MSEFDSQETDVQVGETQESGQDILQQLGQYTSFDYSPEPHYLETDVIIPDEFENDGRDTSPLSEDGRKSLMELDRLLTSLDVAGRRIEVEQTWKACHYERGYQFLLPYRSGGWMIPGTGSNFNGQQQRAVSNLYQTNVYAEKGEIIVSALAREVPKVEFFPANSEYAPDQEMADVSDDLKDIWAKNNDLLKLVQNIAKIFWTDDRCLLWTRYELNGEAYGYEDTEQPTVPETEENPPDTPLQTESSDQYDISNESVTPVTAQRRPRGRVITTAHGKLEHKTPVSSPDVAAMMGVYLCEDKDVSTVKAQFPWMIKKVRGGGDGTGYAELDRIARENVAQAVPGSYVTGDAINRHCVVKHSWIRRSMFYDDSVKPEIREELLAKFPDGVLLVKASTEFAFARNECLDNHIEIGHPLPGKGQNRRALGESLLPIQDYINELVLLILDYAKRTVPKKWMDSEAFNVEALKTQTNVPGSIGPFQRQPGVPVDQLIFVEPTPQPHPWLFALIQWVITSLTEQISGALPSLFGAQISGQVGSEGVATQRDQALQREGCPWNAIQAMIANAARQAVMATAKCANKDINEVIPGKGRVSIRLNSLKGNVLCYPEANPELPESWAQKETRIMSVIDKAMATPGSEFSNMVMDPKNMKAIKSAIRLPGFVIKGASSVAKQEGELEILLRSGPQPNPQKLQLQQGLQAATDGIQQTMGLVQQGLATPEETQQLQQAGPILQQMQQAMQGMPDQISTVQVRQDASEDHAIEASVLFDWMNGPDGRKFQYGNPQQQAAFANVHLHWTEHGAVLAKLAQQNAPPPQPPKVSFSVSADKMPPNEQAQIMSAGGIPANPQDFAVQDQKEMNMDVAKKVIPDTLYTSNLHKQPQQ